MNAFNTPLTDTALEQLFTSARTYTNWTTRSVSDDLLQKIYDLAKMGPTSANCQPMRIVFVKTKESKEKLKDFLYEGNVDKTMTAPVTALFAYDLKFYEHLPTLFPPVDARPWFTQNENDTYVHSFRNATLQAAYFMLAARSLGLDCLPMSGFIADKINELFFCNTTYHVNFICNLGYADHSIIYDRLPRFDFNQVCHII